MDSLKHDKKTRAWENPNVTTTIVQFRTDVTPMVYVFSNIGWMPIGNAPNNPSEAEIFAEKVAKKYKLNEVTIERAKHLAGWSD